MKTPQEIFKEIKEQTKNGDLVSILLNYTGDLVEEEGILHFRKKGLQFKSPEQTIGTIEWLSAFPQEEVGFYLLEPLRNYFKSLEKPTKKFHVNLHSRKQIYVNARGLADKHAYDLYERRILSRYVLAGFEILKWPYIKSKGLK